MRSLSFRGKFFGIISLRKIQSSKEYNYKPYLVLMSTDIDCVFEGIGGFGRIFISGLSSASNSNLLKTLSISAIISVAETALLSNRSSEIQNYLYIPAKDREDYDIRQYFEETYNFIEKSRKSTNILVHCMAGISRSATIVIAYLMKKYQYSLPNTLALLQRKRKKINPNRGFLRQLECYNVEIGVDETLGKRQKMKKICFSEQKKHKESNETSILRDEEGLMDASTKKTKYQNRMSQITGKTLDIDKIIKHKILLFRQKMTEVKLLKAAKGNPNQNKHFGEPEKNQYFINPEYSLKQ